MRKERLVASGLDVLAADPAPIAGKRFAVLANQAAVTRELRPAWQVLSLLAPRGLVRIFAPEHGLWGVAQDMEAVGSGVDPVTGVEVHSLYGQSAASLRPRREWLEDLDAVVVDLPDIGCRYYTFAATMAHVMAACEASGTEVIVLDRPNPLGGIALEGGLVEPGFESFVSELPVPVRHGLTLGELALLLRARRSPGVHLTVVPCSGWLRRRWWNETGLPWVAPSPNMPTLTTAAIYAGACLAEATNLSEGRGTTRPFQLLGAPWIDGERLASRLGERVLPGCGFRATRFRPEFQKHAGRECGGIEWHVVDRAKLRPLETGVRMLQEIRRLWPREFAWRQETYEFVSDVPAIDLLTGGEEVRLAVESGSEAEVEALVVRWRECCDSFAGQRREYLLYPD